jgi:hypothetical protein
MTRQCAWCTRYLDFVQSETCVTHGICENCVERIRHSFLEELLPPAEEAVLTTGSRIDLAKQPVGLPG